MINELNEIAVGFDLGPTVSMITFYTRRNNDPMTVSTARGQEQYEIPTPKNLFSLVEQRSEEGIALLSRFFEETFGLLSGVGMSKDAYVMVTMKKMRPLWAEAVTRALCMLGFSEKKIYLQDHLESFYYYMLNQRRELWSYSAALFEHERDRIVGYVLSANARTSPVLVKVTEAFHFYVDEKARAGMSDAEWAKEKDRLFLEKIQEMFEGQIFTSAYLAGDGFDREWPKMSLSYLCTRRKVFMGQNLFTKGACYGAMALGGMSHKDDYLYAGPDMIEHNIGMEMLVRGTPEFYPMITAGGNWYTARHESEFLLDDVQEIVLYSRHMNGEEMSHTVKLTDLPKRPNRATRIRLRLDFTAKNRCRVHLEDLGLGALYPASQKQWEAVIVL